MAVGFAELFQQSRHQRTRVQLTIAITRGVTDCWNDTEDHFRAERSMCHDCICPVIKQCLGGRQIHPHRESNPTIVQPHHNETVVRSESDDVRNARGN